jgi:hypothetical protein
LQGARNIEKSETVSLSHLTAARRVAVVSGHVARKFSDIAEKCYYFSLCLDETTDQTDVTQLLIFVHIVQSDFSTQEELLCSLKQTTVGLTFMKLSKQLMILVSAPL